MATLMLMILVVLALVVSGLFLPVLWIPAILIVLFGGAYMLYLARESTRQ